MKIAVAIATTGRPLTVAETLLRLARQTRAPDHVVVVGAAESDFPSCADREEDFADVAFTLSARGSSKQRNRALDLLSGAYDLVVFFDDDFVAAKDFLENAENVFKDHPDIVAASGHLLADGYRTAGITFTEADQLVAAYEQSGLVQHVPEIEDQPGAYGCNMIARISAMPDIRFDENLPLYGWLEDLDFSARLRAKGRIVETSRCVGVHLGVKNGRSPGRQIGYSHIANPLYLARKGSIGWRRAFSMAGKVLVANSVRVFAPEPFIDRRGRLSGNLRALGDLVTGRLHPMRVLDLASARNGKRHTGHALS
ncbi:MAG: glycosyltransferase [Methylovirgula sp.]|jgi:GT2 family glycosyltransferase